MLEIGSFRARDCGGLSRRSFLQAAGSLPAALGATLGLGSTLATRPALASGARAKSVIMVWLWGGPSHLDTFDPKPDAPSDVRGPFATIPTKTGERFSELVPRLARISDRFAVLRSTRFSGNHDMLVLTGSRGRAGAHEPNFGAVVASHRRSRTLPPFVSIAPETQLGHGFRSTHVPGFGAGRLGAAHDPFIVSCNAEGKADVPSLSLARGLSPGRLSDRRLLRTQLDALERQVESEKFIEWNEKDSLAYSLLSSGDAFSVFDLASEPDRVHAAYGRTTFGQSALLARRLVESGVPYVHVNWSLGVDGLQEGSNMGWDTHRNGFGQLMNYHCPIFDRAFSALLLDLEDRGLLDSTLVVATGEMGRTPKINKTGGRDHWATCSTLWAGGGVEGGRVVGRTDSIGAEPVTRPSTSLMVGTTIAEAAGLDSQTRAELKVLERGEVISELF